MSKLIRILVVDAYPLIHIGLRTILAASDDLMVVGETTSGDEAQRLCRELQPDVVVLALNVRDSSPFEIVENIRSCCSSTRVLILTAYDDAYIYRLTQARATGYMLKDEAPETIMRAIRTVAQGSTCLSQALTKMLVWPGTTEASTIPPLTKREVDVVRLIVAGKTNREIASLLDISAKTVEKHLGSVYRKLSVTSRTAAALRAVEERLV